MTTPREAGFQSPAEWTPHEAVWVAWPSHTELWEEDLESAQTELVGLLEAIGDIDPDTQTLRGETPHVLVPDAAREAEAWTALNGLQPVFHQVPFGDIWLRDTGPIFTKNQRGEVATLCFGFNGWGGKYELDGDAEVARAIAARFGGRCFEHEIILEGGAVEVDGQGTLLTSRSCMLNPNRNRWWGEPRIERALEESFGVTKIVWIEEGLVNDHTDGHIDTLVRFVAPGKVVCMEAKDDDDPNREVLHAIRQNLEKTKDAKNRPLEVTVIPSPGRVEDLHGSVMPASYVNFYIGNTTVVVPTYGMPYDDEAVEKLQALFPTRKVVGRRARSILSGGGAFHCITQQEPRAETPR